MIKKIRKTTFAYIAGYIDGDGCFNIGKQFIKNRATPRYPSAIIISSTNDKIINWFHNTFGGSFRSPKKRIKGHKPMYYFILRKYKSREFLPHILPYLVEKKEEALLFFEFCTCTCPKKKQNIIYKMKTNKQVGNLVTKYHKEEFEQYKNTITPDKNDFAYLAGFIDAECSLNIQRYKPKNKPNYVYKILLQCNNTKAPVFKWLIERFGGHIHFIDRRNHGKARKNQLTWRLSGKALSKILPDINPFLKYKKPVCKQLIKFYETTLINGGARHTEQFRTEYKRIIKIREDIVSKVHQLNSKGIY